MVGISGYLSDLLASFQLKVFQPLSSDFWHQQDIFIQRTVTHIFSSLGPFFVNMVV